MIINLRCCSLPLNQMINANYQICFLSFLIGLTSLVVILQYASILVSCDTSSPVRLSALLQHQYNEIQSRELRQLLINLELASTLSTQSELEIAQLIVTRFNDLFNQQSLNEEENLSINDNNNNNNNNNNLSNTDYQTTTGSQIQSILETRKIDEASIAAAKVAGAAVAAASAGSRSDELIDRNYFKILSRVFSRVELPELYKYTRGNAQRDTHCGPHIGCIQEIPNFPSLLKKPNVSSSFTIYTPTSPNRSGKRIHFEPIIHHQLKDSNERSDEETHQLQYSKARQSFKDESGIHSNCNCPNKNHHQTAASWRSASKIVRSQEYPFDLAALEQSSFDPALNTRIIVGGYFAKEDEEWIDEIVKQWSLLEPLSNIIKVSWPDANRGLYHTAAYNSRIVGRQLTLFLYYLDQLFNIDLGRFHLVGHSLGAHIAGFVGADFGGRIGRITGLDPAGPIFVELNTSMRLDPSDAQFVDVMHTNGGTITKGALGLSTPSGHVDYYCNGGSIQPGCYFSSVTKSMLDPIERVACNHRRSYRYFTELIKIAIGENGGPGSSGNTAVQLLNNQTNFLLSAGEMILTDDNLLARHFQDDLTTTTTITPPPQPPAALLRQASRFPKAFLFEAKFEDLVRLSQPEIVIMSTGLARREISELAPLKKQLEFHQIKPNFPIGKRGLYFFRTRSESPFFASKQYALTLRTDTIIRRKITLMARIEQTLVAEVELDEIPGLYTIAFAPNDPKILNLNTQQEHQQDTAPAGQQVRIPQISLLWKFRSLNLLLNQQNELALSGIELSLLDDDSEQASPIVRYLPIQSQHLSSSLPTAVLRGISGASGQSSASQQHISLIRNQWHKFEGRLISSWRPTVITNS